MAMSQYDRYASFPPPSDPTDGPVSNFRPGRPSPEGTVFQNPWEVSYGLTSNEGGAGRGYPTNVPPTTQIAAQIATRVAGEGGADRGYPSNATQSVRVPPRNGPPPGRLSQPGDEVYPGRVDMTNAYTNQGGGNGGGYPSISFNAAPAAAGSVGGSGANLGMLPPEFHSQIAELLDAAKPLLNSKGIVDRMRGRQLLGARGRLIDGATSIAGSAIGGANALANAQNAQSQTQAANTNAFRASNEVPLALLNSATHKYSTDVGAVTSRGNTQVTADTSRYHTDSAAASARYASDSTLAAHLPSMERYKKATDLFNAGRGDEGQALASMGHFPPNPRVGKFSQDAAGTGGFHEGPDGTITRVDFDPKTRKATYTPITPSSESKGGLPPLAKNH